jgi:hypothetical protein
MTQMECTNVLIVTDMCMFFAPSLIQGHPKDTVSYSYDYAQAAKQMHTRG